jgi:hypothetical protein
MRMSGSPTFRGVRASIDGMRRDIAGSRQSIDIWDAQRTIKDELGRIRTMGAA